MANLKFYRKSTAPVSPIEGAIWFNTTDKTINVYSANAWEKYAGNLQNANWDSNKQKLTITKYDGSSIELDFSDMASATAIATKLGTFNDAASNTNTSSIHARINKVFADIETVPTQIDAAINKLNVEDKASENQYVSAVSENSGKISVTRAALPVHSVDTTKSSGIGLNLTEGKVSVDVALGKIAEGDNNVVSGNLVYAEINPVATKVSTAVQSIEDTTSDEYAKLSITKEDTKVGIAVDLSLGKFPNTQNGNTQTDGIATIDEVLSYTSATYDLKGAAANVLGSEGDSTDSMTVHGLDKRIDAIETVIGGEDADDVINNLSEVIKYFENVKETDAGAALISTVAGHTSDIETLTTNKVDGVIYENSRYVDIQVVQDEESGEGRYIQLDDAELVTKIDELEGRITNAEAAGVTSFGGKTGAITLQNISEPDSGDIILSINESKELSATIYGLGSAAYTNVDDYATAEQGELAESALQNVSLYSDVNNNSNNVENASSEYLTVSEYDSSDTHYQYYVNLNVAENLNNITIDKSVASAKSVKEYVDKKIHDEIAWAEF